MKKEILDRLEWLIKKIHTDKGAIILTFSSFVVVEMALLGWIPMVIGALALVVSLVSLAILIEIVTDQEDIVYETESEIIPYENWPDSCYVCNGEIPDDMRTRGQFAINKGESVSMTKSIGLCEECTWTYSTLLDNHDELVRIYDDRRI